MGCKKLLRATRSWGSQKELPFEESDQFENITRTEVFRKSLRASDAHTWSDDMLWPCFGRAAV